nr:DUF2141 domain-containing protein [Rhodomicrobium udaipurense]
MARPDRILRSSPLPFAVPQRDRGKWCARGSTAIPETFSAGVGARRIGVHLGIALAALAGAAPALADDFADLRVDVSGLRSYKGRVVLALWADATDSSKYPNHTKIQFRDERPGDPPCDFANFPVCIRSIGSLQNLTVSYTFPPIPEGDYAVFVFHDENSNGIFDTGLFKRPIEGRGFSQTLPEDVNPVAARIGFYKARFALAAPRTLVIGLRYPPRF